MARRDRTNERGLRKGTALVSTNASGKTALRYKLHWHVVFTHFPISFFLLSALFMALHLFTHRACFESAAFVGLIAGAAVMIPTTFTGWVTWKGRYKGARARLFIYKVRIAFAMTALSFGLVVFRAIFLRQLEGVWIASYSAGILILLIGAIAEGYYGGRLNHR
jgi:uncharacterized membrane protein